MTSVGWIRPATTARWTIAKDPKDAYAWRPGLVSLINSAVAARKNATSAGLNVDVLEATIRAARGTIRNPVEEASYATAMRDLRREIRALDVPEAHLPVLNLFKTDKW